MILVNLGSIVLYLANKGFFIFGELATLSTLMFLICNLCVAWSEEVKELSNVNWMIYSQHLGSIDYDA